jgi:4-aminobutyrate aminotransferase-like enzyme
MGNPLACAAALANLEQIEGRDLPARVRTDGPALGARLETLRRFARVRDVRGRGFLWAIEFATAQAAQAVVVAALQRGLIVLQSGPTGTSITLAPPLTIAGEQLARALTLIERTLQETETTA